MKSHEAVVPGVLRPAIEVEHPKREVNHVEVMQPGLDRQSKSGVDPLNEKVYQAFERLSKTEERLDPNDVYYLTSEEFFRAIDYLAEQYIELAQSGMVLFYVDRDFYNIGKSQVWILGQLFKVIEKKLSEKKDEPFQEEGSGTDNSLMENFRVFSDIPMLFCKTEGGKRLYEETAALVLLDDMIISGGNMRQAFSWVDNGLDSIVRDFSFDRVEMYWENFYKLIISSLKKDRIDINKVVGALRSQLRFDSIVAAGRWYSADMPLFSYFVPPEDDKNAVVTTAWKIPDYGVAEYIRRKCPNERFEETAVYRRSFVDTHEEDDTPWMTIEDSRRYLESRGYVLGYAERR